MARFAISSVSIDGIGACVPKAAKDYNDYRHLLTEKEYAQFVKATGVASSRKANPCLTTADYAAAAAEKLISEMHLDRQEIELLVFVSQSPDYTIPMTACLLQERLGLSKQCLAFDITSGCSGYVQGVSVVASMLHSGRLRRALLLCGDTNDYQLSPNDKTTGPLFGTAASATLLSYAPHAHPLCFEMGTDGSGAEAIMIRDGGGRHPFSAESLIEHQIAKGITRNNCQLSLSGEAIFSFAISEVPDSIERLYNHFGLKIEHTDYFIFHQANKLIIETIADILEIPMEKVPMSLKAYGNTSSASIPLTLVSELRSIKKPTKLCLSGFGSGLSWGTLYMETESIFCSELIEI